MKLTTVFRIFLSAAAFFAASVSSVSRDMGLRWNGTVNALAGSGEYLPFWARTGNDGIMPYTSSGVVTLGADFEYVKVDGWSLEAGTNLVGALASASSSSQQTAYGFVDRLYLSGAWKMIHLDLGMKPRERELADISISGGNFSYSRNARNLPGVNLWTDWVWTGKGRYVALKANLAHYQMVDDRWVDRTMLHNKALAIKFALGRSVDLILGAEDWAMWGGESPVHGAQPSSFSDYVKVVTGAKGDSDATLSDQINALGNHLGREYLRLDWRLDGHVMTFQYDKPFEDGSGIKFRNFPDGIWSFQLSARDRKALVTDVIYEFVTTTWQSGPLHDRPATEEELKEQNPDSPMYGRYVLGGRDDYFSHGEYLSGWTIFNRTAGCPLIIPCLPVDGGYTPGLQSTRVRGHHFGVKGVAFNKVPYRFLATYTRNFGRYNQGPLSFFASAPRQLSLALEVGLPEDVLNLPIALSLGAYADVGELYQDSVGLTLKIKYGDSLSF